MGRATNLSRATLFGILLAGAALLLHGGPPTRARQSDQEIVANLATGRVIVCIARDAILIGAESEKSEPGSHAPLFVPLNGGHVAVLLGAVEWIALNSGKPPVRLDTELAAVGNRALLKSAMVVNGEPDEAGDLEALGIAFLERFRPVANQLHHELSLKPDEPVLQMLVIGYKQDYGPEVWVLSYKLQQRPLRGDYWDTLVMRPSYTQLYPPEKHAPHMLVEFRYPPDIKGPTLMELLGENDQRLLPVRAADKKVAEAAQLILDGASSKAASEPATAFMRGALTATANPDSKITLAVLHEGDRFDWIIPPAETPQKPGDDKRDPAAPTLRGPHHQ